MLKWLLEKIIRNGTLAKCQIRITDFLRIFLQNNNKKMCFTLALGAFLQNLYINCDTFHILAKSSCDSKNISLNPIDLKAGKLTQRLVNGKKSFI